MATKTKRLGQGLPELSPATDLQLEERTTQRLTDILYAHELVEEPENPTILCAWTYDQNGAIGELVLFLDGGDAEEGGVLFYQRTRDTTGCVQEAVHVPDSWHQARLRNLAGWQCRPESQSLYARMTRAGLCALADPMAWKQLDT